MSTLLSSAQLKQSSLNSVLSGSDQTAVQGSSVYMQFNFSYYCSCLSPVSPLPTILILLEKLGDTNVNVRKLSLKFMIGRRVAEVVLCHRRIVEVLGLQQIVSSLSSLFSG